MTYNVDNISEGFFDRIGSGLVRAKQAYKNATGIGSQTSDSKDAAVIHRFETFKRRFESLKDFQSTPTNTSTQPAQASAGSAFPNYHVTETLNENSAMNSRQTVVLHDFLDDLNKMFNLEGYKTNNGRQLVLQFLAKQGDRFKEIVDYLKSINVIAPDKSTTQPDPAQQAPVQPTVQSSNELPDSIIENLKNVITIFKKYDNS